MNAALFFAVFIYEIIVKSKHLSRYWKASFIPLRKGKTDEAGDKDSRSKYLNHFLGRFIIRLMKKTMKRRTYSISSTKHEVLSNELKPFGFFARRKKKKSFFSFVKL